MEKIFEFARKEHERQLRYHNLKNDPKTKYTILAKLMEEVGELSEAILKKDRLQHARKLRGLPSVADELADVILVALILGEELKIDTRMALLSKMKKITARKY